MKNKIYSIAIAALIITVLGGIWWFMKTVGEFGKPTIAFSEDIRSIGRQKIIQACFEDSGTGLREIFVSINQNNKSRVLIASSFPEKGVKQKKLSLRVNPQLLKLHDGFAVLTVATTDYSLWKNKTIIERPINIDYTPPRISLLTPTSHINVGGACVIAYGLSEPAPLSGVQVNNNFSQGYLGTFAGKTAVIAYFALPPEVEEKGASIKIFARDGGGNETYVSLFPLIKKKKFRSDKMNLTDSFLNQKMGDFQPLPPELQGKDSFDIFTYINGQMRIANENSIRDLCRKSEPRQLWDGTFLRMKNASPMALFGDHRTYLYGNKAIGESTHLGVDLASTANAPVEAANNGIVVFVGTLGIYGNAIIIDHGLGIFSVYGHLSSISTKTGQTVKKGDVIGNTGTTGLAGGDHLHFGMLVGGQFVNPVEWWDPHWIKDNVADKLTNVNN
jgi:hypothetical protein